MAKFKVYQSVSIQGVQFQPNFIYDSTNISTSVFNELVTDNLISYIGNNVDVNTLANDAAKTAIPFAVNLKNGLSNWKSKLNNIPNNKILNINIVGDSISEGAKATPSYRNNGYVGLLRNYFNSVYGDVGGGYAPSYYPNDAPLVTKTGAGWTTTNFGTTSNCLQSPTVGDYLEFTINAPGVEIYYPKGNGGGIMQISVDGVVWGTVNEYSGSIIPTNIYTIKELSNAQHTIRLANIAGGTGTTLFFNGFREIKGTQGIRINMCARWGTITNDGVGSYSIDAINKLTPDLTIIAYVANDANLQTSLATYATNIQTLITNAKLTGDVLIIGNGIHNPNSTPLLETSYTDILAGLALLNNCGFIDINKAWSNNGVIANQMGYMSDNVHPNNTGHQFYYNTILNAIT